MDKPLILISNDDGIDAKGLYALIDFVKEMGEIWVIAPATPQSGKSSAITVEIPLRIVQHDDYNGAKMFSIDGTPVDTVKLGIHAVLPRTPDCILSGINHGANTGVSVLYSGTMGVAYEGCVRNIPSVGFSYLNHAENVSFATCEPIVKEVVAKVLKSGLPKGVCLNVNMPKNIEIKGVKTAKASRGMWAEEYVEQVDPRGRSNYWLTGGYVDFDAESTETDLYWLKQGYASAVPCRIDQTDFEVLNEIDTILNA